MARSKNVINIRALRATTKRAQRRAEVRHQEQCSREQEEIRRKAKKLARGIISALPKRIKKAAREGSSELQVFDSLGMRDSREFRAIVSFVADFCSKNDLRYETREYKPMGSDDYPAHSYMMVYWGEGDRPRTW